MTSGLAPLPTAAARLMPPPLLTVCRCTSAQDQFCRLGPDEEWSTEKPADPIELRIYRGADGDFTLYEDENDNYDYEKGAYATIPLHWDDAGHTLTMGDRKGQFPGMLESRSFRRGLCMRKHGRGVSPNDGDKIVQYSGKQITVTP